LKRLPSIATTLPDVAAESDELLAQLADRRTVVLAEVGDRLEVRPQPAGQPDELEIPAAFALQPPRRLRLVQVAVEIDPQNQARMVARATRRLGHRAEAERREIEASPQNASITRTGFSSSTLSYRDNPAAASPSSPEDPQTAGQRRRGPGFSRVSLLCCFFSN